MLKVQDINIIRLKLRIYFTNWINVTGIIIGTYIFLVINELFMTGILALPQVLIMGLITIVLYGGIFFAGFLTCMLLLDFVLMNDTAKYLRSKLITEWALISVPFIYWLLIYSEWVFLVAVILFFITQLIREKTILKLLAYKQH